MPTRPQHARTYRPLPAFLRQLREEADLTQRALGGKLQQPQSWVQRCETGVRRVDVTEFATWAKACGVDPKVAFHRLMAKLRL